MKPLRFRSPPDLIKKSAVLLACWIMLSACVEDTQLAGVSGGGTGAPASGVVTGFGSIIVDGKSWNDSQAVVRSELDPLSGPVLSTVRLGQRVDIAFEVDGKATGVQLRPSLVGPLNFVAGNEWIVLGQRVRINMDPALGPVTQFEVGKGPLSIVAGQIVEVHGNWIIDSVGPAILQASRIDRLTGLPSGFASISGTVEDFDPVFSRFRIGELQISMTSQTLRLGAFTTPGNGQQVTVWSRLQPAGPTFFAEAVRLSAAVEPGIETTRSGVVSRYDRITQTFSVNGIAVNASDALLTPRGLALANGQYIRMVGAFDQAGRLVAREITLRRADIEAEVSLRGSVTDFSSLSAFNVRGVLVDASSAVLDVSTCPPGVTNVANAAFVGIVGTALPNGVKASVIRCEPETEGVVLEVSGTVVRLDRGLRIFMLQGQGLVRPVVWNEVTQFTAPLTPMVLSDGVSVKIEAVLLGNVLFARRIESR